MPGKLATLIRTKHPGAYDDMDDVALEKAVLAKYPEYADLADEKPKGDTYKGPSTWAEGFSESVKDTVTGTAKSFLGNAAAIVNPMTYVRGYEAKKADEARMMKELETGVVDLPDDYGAGKVRADLKSLTTPEGGGAALAALVTAGVLPKVPGVVGRVAGKVDAGAAVRAAKTGMDLVRHPIRTVVGAVVDEAARRMGPTAEVRAIANPAPTAVAEAAPVAAKAAPVVAEAVPILDEAGRPLGGTTVPEATVGAQKPKYAGPERRLTPDEQVRRDLRDNPEIRMQAEAMKARFETAKAAKKAAGVQPEQPTVIAPKVFNELAIAAKRAKIKLSPVEEHALAGAMQEGVTAAEAVSTLVQQRLSKIPGVMSNAQVDAEIAARGPGNRSPSRK